jgi:hypothetical protein
VIRQPSPVKYTRNWLSLKRGLKKSMKNLVRVEAFIGVSKSLVQSQRLREKKVCSSEAQFFHLWNIRFQRRACTAEVEDRGTAKLRQGKGGTSRENWTTCRARSAFKYWLNDFRRTLLVTEEKIQCTSIKEKD